MSASARRAATVRRSSLRTFRSAPLAGVPPSAAAAEARWGHVWSYELTPDGPDATIVTEIFDCSRAPEEERVDIDNGKIWAKAMAETLERLDRACTDK